MEKYLIAIVMVFYPLLLFNGNNPTPGSSLFLTSAFLYLMTIYLYFGMTWLLHHKENLLFTASSVISVLLGLYVTDYQQMTLVLTSLGMIVLAPVVVVKMYLLSFKQNKIYFAAALLICSLQMIQLSETLPVLETVLETGTELTISSYQDVFEEAGYSQEQINSSIIYIKKILNLFARLLPATTILDMLVKFSIGYLLFDFRLSKRYNSKAKIELFPQWKMPFYIAPFLIVAMLARMFGGEFLVVVADNVLVILSVYYSLMGLSIVNFYIKKLQLSIWIKYSFYLLMFLSQLVGYFMAVILGFVDSFMDWRKLDDRVVVK